MVAVRSSFEPTKIEVNQGDKVTIYMTNIEQTTDELHGFGSERVQHQRRRRSGRDQDHRVRGQQAGVFPFYCTNFCSALHQEMQGYLLVKPK